MAVDEHKLLPDGLLAHVHIAKMAGQGRDVGVFRRTKAAIAAARVPRTQSAAAGLGDRP